MKYCILKLYTNVKKYIFQTKSIEPSDSDDESSKEVTKHSIKYVLLINKHFIVTGCKRRKESKHQ